MRGVGGSRAAITLETRFNVLNQTARCDAESWARESTSDPRKATLDVPPGDGQLPRSNSLNAAAPIKYRGSSEELTRESGLLSPFGSRLQFIGLIPGDYIQ